MKLHACVVSKSCNNVASFIGGAGDRLLPQKSEDFQNLKEEIILKVNAKNNYRKTCVIMAENYHSISTNLISFSKQLLDLQACKQTLSMSIYP